MNDQELSKPKRKFEVAEVWSRKSAKPYRRKTSHPKRQVLRTKKKPRYPTSVRKRKTKKHRKIQPSNNKGTL